MSGDHHPRKDVTTRNIQMFQNEAFERIRSGGRQGGNSKQQSFAEDKTDERDRDVRSRTKHILKEGERKIEK